MSDQYWRDVIDPGDRLSAFAHQVCVDSHRNCPAVIIIPHIPGHFRGPVSYIWQPHVYEEILKAELSQDKRSVESWVMAERVENDGAGGKPQFFGLVGIEAVLHGLGWEIITMSADDLARSGCFPAIMLNDLNIKGVTKENFKLCKAIFGGYRDALKKAGLINITGEIAIMKHQITAFFDTGNPAHVVATWGGACLGLAHRDKLIDGSKIRPGMPIVGFWEPGYRCNGGTFFTNILLAIYKNVRTIMGSDAALEFIQKLCVPSQSYARTICRIHGWNDDGSIREALANIVGIAHITGGGIWSKLGDLLPKGVGAHLDTMPRPADVLLEAQNMSWDLKGLRLTDLQAHGTLHGGCGMFVVAETNEDAERIIAEADKDGIKAQVVGLTIPSHQNEIAIESRFREGHTLSSLEL